MGLSVCYFAQSGSSLFGVGDKYVKRSNTADDINSKKGFIYTVAGGTITFLY